MAHSQRRLNVLQSHLAKAPVSSLIEQQLKYTLDESTILTQQEKQFYEENGYFVMKNLISADKIEKFRKRFQQICDNEIVIPEMLVMKDVKSVKDKRSEYTVNKIQSFQSDDVLMEYCKDPEIIKYVEAFVGKDIMAMHTMLINKPPDTGSKTSRHPLHQDLHYFPFRPADRIVASWTAMQRITRENGCLVVLPGTHKGHLLQHDYPKWEGGVNKYYHGVRDFDPNQPRLYLEMNPGDTVFFHPLLIHGSGANTSKNFRKAISCHYASSYCHYIDIKGTIQEAMAKEVVEITRKKLGNVDDTELDFKDFWYIKGRLIKGNRIHL